MNKYLYIFGYETPLQKTNNAVYGWDDEDSAAVFILASSEQQALAWGHMVARKFVGVLFNRGFPTGPDQITNWDENAFAAWIDNDYAKNYSSEQLRAIPTVEYGEYPDIDIAAMITSKYGNPALTTAGSNS